MGHLELCVDMMGYGCQLEVGGQVLLLLGQLPRLDIKCDATPLKVNQRLQLNFGRYPCDVSH